jgi:hypothetical protein
MGDKLSGFHFANLTQREADPERIYLESDSQRLQDSVTAILSEDAKGSSRKND